MNKGIYRDMREQMKPDDDLVNRLNTAIKAESFNSTFEKDTPLLVTDSSAKAARNKAPARFKRSLTLYISAAAAVVAVLIAAGILISGAFGNGKVSVAEADPVKAPADYRELYQILDEASSENRWFYTNSYSDERGTAVELQVLGGNLEVEKEAPAEADTNTGPGFMGEGYSTTNVQVAGIDEGDIIKTDGSYIYVLSGNQLVILAAAGADTSELARLDVIVPDDDGYVRDYASELYISGSVAAVILNNNSPVTTRNGYFRYEPNSKVLCYDISEPSEPRLLAEFAQSGYYNSSRMQGNVLYLLSNYSVYEDLDVDDPATYVPELTTNGTKELIACEDIRVMPIVAMANYTVITSLDLNTQHRIDQKSVLGWTETVYMSYKNLYLGSTIWVSEDSEPYKESVYTVVDHVDSASTQLIRIALDQGNLNAAAECIVQGTLLNQFSLDEYEDNLRLVVTIDNYSYRIFRDAAYDIESIQYGDDRDQSNSVYILDPSMNLLGSIEGLGIDESIYSARFAGPVAYMVTFRQVDPLFALDLSDPTDPQVTDELKIPGFSTYLHPFGDGRLLGIGYDVSDNRTTGIKISMFDTSDPFKVSESSVELVDTDYSEALYNHKAVLVDVERNIIGFPGEQYAYYQLSYKAATNDLQYFLYAYEDEAGFILLAVLDLSNPEDEPGYYYYYGGSIRGLYIGSFLYVYSGYYVDVFDLVTLEKVQTVSTGDGTKQPYKPYPVYMEE